MTSILGSLEPHDPKEAPMEPDWEAIYQFISCILQGDIPPMLSPIGEWLAVNTVRLYNM